jgi:hypothetical protein
VEKTQGRKQIEKERDRYKRKTREKKVAIGAYLEKNIDGRGREREE